MLKLNFFMRKRDDRSLDQFSNYWRENHGPFALSGRTTRLGMRRYVQNHLVMTPLADHLARAAAPGGTAYEGICQLWFDSEEAVLRSRSSADGAAATGDLVQDELNFLDLPRCSIRFYREECCIDGRPGSGAHKLVIAMDFADAGQAALFGRQTAAILARAGSSGAGLVRAVQNFGLDTPANDKLRAPRGNDRRGLDYALELWFCDYASLCDAATAQAGLLAQLLPVVTTHRGGEVSVWVAEERLMIGGDLALAPAA